jgi:hypothetical protein
MSDFVMTVEMWVSTFNVKTSFPSIVCCAFISIIVRDCVVQSFSETRSKVVLKLSKLLKLGTKQQCPQVAQPNGDHESLNTNRIILSCLAFMFCLLAQIGV